MNDFWMGYGMIFPLLAYLIVIVLPIAVIVGKAGYSRWWAVLALIPMINLIALWVFAFSPWPGTRK